MPFRSVGSRLALALLVIVAGVLAIVYVIVVPSFRHSLQNEELRSLSSSLQKVALPAFPAEFDLRAQYVNEMAPAVDARVAVLYVALRHGARADAPTRTSTSARPISRRIRSPCSPSAASARRAASSTRSGEQYAEVAVAAPNEPRSVVLLSSPLRAQLQTVSVVRRRLLIAGGVSTRVRRARRLCRRAASSRGGCGGSSRRRSGSRPGTSRSRSSTRAGTRSASSHAGSSACACGSPGSTAPAASSSPTPRTSCERRSSRSAASSSCSRSRSSTPATREEFLVSMREQVARLAKLATDLLDLSRLDAGRLTPVSETVDLAGLAAELTAEFTPRAAATGHALDVEYGAPVEARGDAERILQIGRILVENALVHTPAGTQVRLAASLDGHRALLDGHRRRPRHPARGAPAGVRALLPARRRPRLRQRPRARDRARARGA